MSQVASAFKAPFQLTAAAKRDKSQKRPETKSMNKNLNIAFIGTMNTNCFALKRNTLLNIFLVTLSVKLFYCRLPNSGQNIEPINCNVNLPLSSYYCLILSRKS